MPEPVVQPQQANEVPAVDPHPGQNLTPEETILRLQNQINSLSSELNKKDQIIAVGNSTNQALEANQAVTTQKNLDLETENMKMNKAIQQATSSFQAPVQPLVSSMQQAQSRADIEMISR